MNYSIGVSYRIWVSGGEEVRDEAAELLPIDRATDHPVPCRRVGHRRAIEREQVLNIGARRCTQSAMARVAMVESAARESGHRGDRAGR
jgi:hypothetical protein